MRHVLSVSDWRREDIRWILSRACEWKSAHRPVTCLRAPRGALILERPALRTRIAYESAMHLLGGSLTVFDSGVGTSDSIDDVGRVLSGMLDIAFIRTRSHAMLEQLSKTATIPIINVLSNREHPVEVLADALTIRDTFGNTEGRKIAFVGTAGNVCTSLLLLAPLLGMDAAVATPEGFAPSEDTLRQVRALASSHGTGFMDTRSVEEAVRDADVVYTDGWPRLDDADEEERLLGPYRVTPPVMAQASADAIFLHCLPAARNREVTHDVLDSEQSYAFRRLENLAPTSAAMIEWALECDSA
ncbi:ornithine carbamoyltransferase [Candidatus Bipolaricaulota bacterium]|nr:ornithine carbamoyltransferase [Candidatus Bipolaricaulota bacterium]